MSPSNLKYIHIDARITSFVADFSRHCSQISEPEKNVEYGPVGFRKI